MTAMELTIKAMTFAMEALLALIITIVSLMAAKIPEMMDMASRAVMAAKAVEASTELHLIRRSEKFRLVPEVDLACRLAKEDSVKEASAMLGMASRLVSVA